MERFQVYRVYREGTSFRPSIEEQSVKDLGEGELLIRVHYSSLNYKDALSATGAPGVTRNYPHVPGIDAAGTVVEGTDSFPPGTEVIATGGNLGVNAPGGYSEMARIPQELAVALPRELSLREAAALGTAGLTAALCVEALQSNLTGETAEGAPILVTGATGGVGSLATAILTRLGYPVDALSGKPSAAALLAASAPEARIVPREELEGTDEKPLRSARWRGAVDTVGGAPLGSLLKSIGHNGVVAACGNAAGVRVETTVLPFILRALRLVGIDSVALRRDQRLGMWSNLAGPWKPRNLDSLVSEITLSELPEAIETVLQGDHQGRTVVRIGPRDRHETR